MGSDAGEVEGESGALKKKKSKGYIDTRK